MVLNKEAGWIFRDSNTIKTSLGYLVCSKCKGYYKLKDDELPTDFTGCECGNTLEFIENKDYLLNISQIPEYYDEYEELQKIINIVRTNAQKRKEFLEKLHKRIKTQEKLLNEIKHERVMEVKYNKWSLWDLLEEKGLDIKDQNVLIEDLMGQENKLMEYVKEKRNDTGIAEDLNNNYAKMGVLVVAIVLLSILTIYAIK
jgi:hypothetical protein